MASNTSGCHPKGSYLLHARGPRAYQVVLMAMRGLMLPLLMSYAKDKGASLTSPFLTTPSTIQEVVPKTVVSSKLRMSILVGLEGSGHHYLIKVARDMFHSNDEISDRATPCINDRAYYTKSSMKSSPKEYANLHQHARDDMRELALREQSLPWPGHLARLCHERSYPNGGGVHKVMHYIDLRMLAEMAEEEGVDLRVVYLKRSAHDLLVANTVHRHFQKALGQHPNTMSPDHKFIEYVLIAMTDAAVMHSFLAEIDPAFVVCHDFAHAGEEEQVARVANFVAPSAEIAKMYETSLLQVWTEHPQESEELPIEGAEAVTARLQQKLDAFESLYCG